MILREHQVKAVFFVVGQQIVEHPDLLAEISNQGHVIGIHTYTHNNISEMSQGELEEEIASTALLIQEITGQNPVYFRPPRGKFNNENIFVIRNLGYVPVLWDVGLEANAVSDPGQLVNRLMIRVFGKPKPVILLHDGDPSHRHDRTPTVQALPILINQFRHLGYDFADPWNEQCFEHVELMPVELNQEI